MTAIKICGVRDPQTCDLLAELKVNWLGLVFFPASPRYITPDQAAILPDYGQDEPQRIGLFVKPTLEVVLQTLDKVRLDGLQLYTSEENALRIREKTGLPVWLAQGVRTEQDLPVTSSLDGMVIEAPAYETDNLPGGNGRTFDWTLTKTWQSPTLWLLAGGLTVGNVQQAIQESGAKAVDVSSGVECQRGVKDPSLIRQFVQQVRQMPV